MNCEHLTSPATTTNTLSHDLFPVRFAGFLGGLALTLLVPTAVSAATTNTLTQNPALNNSAAVTELINAINSAESCGSPVTINLFPNATYTLTQPNNWEYGPNGLPQITGNLTINGQGATLQRATNSPDFRFFYVSGGLSYNSKTAAGLSPGNLVLLDLTLTDGSAQGGNGAGQGGGGAGMGGAIFNQGTVCLTNVAILGNTARGGNCLTNGGDGGGGGIGSNGGPTQGGGFGGSFLGSGGKGGSSALGGGGGGGGFRPSDRGGNANATNSGIGGGLGMLATIGDGGNGGDAGSVGVADGGANGGSYGIGGYGVGGGGAQSGGGGGIGGGGGHGGINGVDGNGGFGGGGGGGGEVPGDGGFGGGGGSGNEAGGGGFAAGPGTPEDQGGGGGGGMGGAIFNHQGFLSLVNCTLTGNTAEGGNGFDAEGISLYYGDGVGGSGFGGAIFNLNGTVTLQSTTVVSNSTVPGATTTILFRSPGGATVILTNLPTGGAGGGALYNLAYGNRIQDGSASIAFVCLTNSFLAGSIGGSNDVVNNEINGRHINSATVSFCTNNFVMTSCNLSGASCAGQPAGAVCGLPCSPSHPILGMTQVAGHPILFWPTNFSACSLESSSSCLPSGSWTPMTCTPAVVSGQFVLQNLNPTGNQFFRLVTP